MSLDDICLFFIWRWNFTEHKIRLKHPRFWHLGVTLFSVGCYMFGSRVWHIFLQMVILKKDINLFCHHWSKYCSDFNNSGTIRKLSVRSIDRCRFYKNPSNIRWDIAKMISLKFNTEHILGDLKKRGILSVGVTQI